MEQEFLLYFEILERGRQKFGKAYVRFAWEKLRECERDVYRFAMKNRSFLSLP